MPGLSLLLLLAIPLVSHQLVAAEEPKPAEERAENAGAAVGEKKKEAVLTVVVTGARKPVEEAEVTVTFPPAIGGEAKLRTDTRGEATFKSPGPGVAKVRVILEGWASELQEVSLKPGSQRVTIELKPL